MVCILLSTYNGELYLEEQLESLIRQEGVEIRILVRDDRSKDSTCEILNKWQDKGLLTWYTGVNKGPAQSFMDLLYHAPEADYYAFCDQDDVWLPDKLKVAVSKLEMLPDITTVPAMYFSTQMLVDANLNELGINQINYIFSFGESLLRNPAGGCTIVFNKALQRELIAYHPAFVSMHDSWTYRVCLAIGGHIVYDPVPHILYRQHGHNVVGGKKSFGRTVKRRFKSLINGVKGERLRTVKNLLDGYGDKLSPHYIYMLTNLLNYRNSFKAKLRLLFTTDFKTASLDGRIAFWIAILSNRY